MNIKLIIPARYESTRLPGKPLITLHGISMLRRTFLQCAKAVKETDIYIATDDVRIIQHCNEWGMQSLLTSKSCLTGTDRIAEVSKLIEADVYVNVQGDEPLINPEDIKLILEEVKNNPDVIFNGYAEILTEEEFRNPSIPKVVFNTQNDLLYMSRQAIPTTKKLEFKKSWKQICIYAFPKKSLHLFASTEHKTLLESLEDIEILRFLELGLPVKMIQLSGSSMAVDTPEDVEKVSKILKATEC